MMMIVNNDDDDYHHHCYDFILFCLFQIDPQPYAHKRTHRHFTNTTLVTVGNSRIQFCWQQNETYQRITQQQQLKKGNLLKKNLKGTKRKNNKAAKIMKSTKARNMLSQTS